MSTTAGPGPAPETEALLQRVASVIAGARALPLSSSVKLDNKDEVLELLREAIERLPDELRQARWMLKEREEFLAGTQRKADELVEAARSEAQRMVQRTEIAKEAQLQARRLVEEARDEARRLRLEAEDYADQRLAQFEIVLERTLKTVSSGRQKLSGLPDKGPDADFAEEPFTGEVPGIAPAGPRASGRSAGGPEPRRAPSQVTAQGSARAGGPRAAGLKPAAGSRAGGARVGAEAPLPSELGADKRRHGRHSARGGPGLAGLPAEGSDGGAGAGREAEAIFDQDMLD